MNRSMPPVAAAAVVAVMVLLVATGTPLNVSSFMGLMLLAGPS